MANETNQMEAERENLATVIMDQPPQTADPRFYEGTMFGLPREWMVEARPQKASSKYDGKMDQPLKFFYEPGTHRQFRSLKAAKRHLGLDVGLASQKRKPKASKVTRQFKNLHENDQFELKTAGWFKNADEKDGFGSNSKVAEEDKSEENYHDFDKIAKRIRWQLLNGEENSWDVYVKVPDAVQKRWMDTFVQPNDNNQESNPAGMK